MKENKEETKNKPKQTKEDKLKQRLLKEIEQARTPLGERELRIKLGRI